MNKIKLLQILETHFNESELRHLCFLLEIDYENLPGQTKQDKVRELVTYSERHGLSKKLEAILPQLRPALDWSGEPGKQEPSTQSTHNETEKKGGGIHITGRKVTIKGDVFQGSKVIHDGDKSDS